jgi:hypothetical protein
MSGGPISSPKINKSNPSSRPGCIAGGIPKFMGGSNPANGLTSIV